MKRKQMISFVLAGTLSASSLSMYAQPVITELPRIEIQDDVQTTTSPAIEIVPEDRPTVLPLLPEDYEQEANKPVTLPMTPEDYEKMESVPLEEPQLEVNEEGYTVIQYNEGTLQETIENLGIEFPEKLKLEGSQLLTYDDFNYLTDNAIYLDLFDVKFNEDRLYSQAFSYSNIVSIKLPKSLKTIGAEAFKGCYQLEKVILPSTLIEIEEGSFQECLNLKEISLTEGLLTIGDYAFLGCTSLETVILPKSLTSIGMDIFQDIAASNSNFFVGVYSDSLAHKKMKLQKTPFKVMITLLEVDDINLEMPYGAIIENSIKFLVELKDTDGKIYEYDIQIDPSEIDTFQEGKITVFRDIYLDGYLITNQDIQLNINIEVMPKIDQIGKIKKVVNENMEIFTQDTFNLPFGIEVVLLNDEKIKIPVKWDTRFFDPNKEGVYTLEGELILPEGIENPYNFIPKLIITVKNSSSNTESSIEDFEIDETGRLIKYKGKANNIIIPEGVTVISSDAFPFLSKGKIESIIFPSTLKKIETSAFQGFSNLEKVVFNEGLEEIGNTAFSMCSKLESIVLPSTLKTIGTKAFAVCKNLVGVDLGGGVETIGEMAFNNCNALEYVLGTENLKEIKKMAFLSCISLNKINLENVEKIGNKAFENVVLEELQFNKLQELGTGAFSNNGSLKKLDFGNSPIEVISDSAFLNNFNLKEIHLPLSLKEVGNAAFKLSINDTQYGSSKGMITFNFPETLEVIQDKAFENNYHISEVTFNAPCILGKNAFTEKLNKMYVSDDITFNGKKKNLIEVNKLIIKNNISQLDLDILPNSVQFDPAVNSIKLDIFSRAEILRIPNNIQKITFNMLPEEFNTLLIVDENSYAHEFARNNQLDFVIYNESNQDFLIKDGILEKYIGEKDVEQIILPEGITQIRSNAFSNIVAEEIILPNTLNKIETNAFSNIDVNYFSVQPMLETLVLENDFISNSNVKRLEINLDHIKEKEISLKVNVDTLALFINREILEENAIVFNDLTVNKLEIISDTLTTMRTNSLILKAKNVILNEGLEVLEDNTFGDQGLVDEVLIPETLHTLGNLKYINNIQFKEKSSLTVLNSFVFDDNYMDTLELPNSVTTIRNDAFNRGNLERVIIPDSVVNIEPKAFNNLSSYFEIITPEDSVAWNYAKEKGIKCISLEEYESNVFEINGSYLVKYRGKEKVVHVPEGISDIDSNAFANNPYIEEVYLPETTRYISYNAFENALNLKKVEAHNISDIRDKAFKNTPNLSEFISDSIETIGEEAFYNSGIQYIDLETVASIGNSAFKGTNLISIKTGNKLEEIGNFIFKDCKNLEIADLGESIKLDTLNNQMFGNTTSLKSVILPKKLHFLGKDVFLNSSLRRIKIPNSLMGFTYPDAQPGQIDEKLFSSKSNLIYVVSSNHPKLANFKNMYNLGQINLEIENLLKVIEIEKFEPINVLKNTNQEDLKLPKTVSYYLTEDKQVDLSVLEWDLSQVDFTKKGSYVVKGKTNIEEIIKKNPEDKALKTIQAEKDYIPLLKINVVNEGLEILDILDSKELYREVDYNTSFFKLNLPTEVNVLLENGEEDLLKVNWNKKDYNPKQVGQQIFYGTLDLEDQYLNEKDVKVKVVVKVNKAPTIPDEPSKPVEKPLEVIKPAIHKSPLIKLEPAIVSSPLIPLNPAQTVKEELPVITPPQEEKPLEKPIDRPQDEDTNTQQKVDSTNNNVDKNTSNKQPSENDTIKTNAIQEWIEIEPSLPIQTLEDTQTEQKEDVAVPQVPISENVIVNEDSEQPTNRFYEQVQKLFPNVSYNTFILLSSSIVFIVIALILVIVVYINKKRKEKKMNN